MDHIVKDRVFFALPKEIVAGESIQYQILSPLK